MTPALSGMPFWVNPDAVVVANSCVGNPEATIGPRPLLFQFSKFDKYAFKSLDDFLALLIPFLKKLPKEHTHAVVSEKSNLEPRCFKSVHFSVRLRMLC